jgi:hypothetical protein
MIEHLLRIIDGYACGEEDTKRRQEIQVEYDKAVAAAVVAAAAAVQTQSPAVEQAAVLIHPMQPANQGQPPRPNQAPMT